MTISRRRFLQLGSLASASLMVPRFLNAMPPDRLPAGQKRLIVVQLSGGNDGLNTVIPYRNDIYYRSRQQIAIPRAQALALNDETGLHPAMKGIKQLYGEGAVSVINGVGYPEPDRSHFRSMDIWQTGSGSDEILTNGWIGRYLDHASKGCNEHNALALEADDSLSLAMKGAEKNGIAVQDVRRLHAFARSRFVGQLSDHAADHHDKMAGYLYKTLAETTASAEYIYQQSRVYAPKANYPDTALGRRCQLIAQLINSGSETKVFYVSHGSFDTHAGQPERQARLLKQLDEALSALVADLKANNTFSETLIMTFSEFGRRVAQNASNGTDHGAAGCMFLVSGSLKKAGVYNAIPDLSDLEDGDLKYSTDFRRVYATVLGNWLGADVRQVLGRDFEQLGVV